MPKRFQNQLYVGYPRGTLKNTIFDVKTSPRWTTKIFDFFEKPFTNSSYYGLWSKMPLGSHQEPPKSLLRTIQGPSRASQKPSRSPHAASKRVSEGRVASCPCRCIWNCSLELECLCQCNLSHSSPITIKDFFACHLTLHWLRILFRSSSTIYVFDSFTDWFACLSLRGGVVFIFSSRISQECLYIIFRCGCQNL